MRKKILILLMAMVFAAAALLPATASATANIPICHKGEVIFADFEGQNGHFVHGDTPALGTPPAC